MYYESTNELYHHGIKGQKWGVRRWQNADGTYNEAGKKRYGGEKRNEKKAAVYRYSKAMNEADRTQEIADKAYSKSKEAYDALGKTKLSRVVEAFKGSIGKGSEAYKRYSKAYDKAVETQEVADEAYKKAKAAYTETGKTFAGRVLNNIRYDPSLKRNGGPGFMESIKIEAETGHPWDEKPRARDPWDEKPRRGSGYNI